MSAVPSFGLSTVRPQHLTGYTAQPVTTVMIGRRVSEHITSTFFRWQYSSLLLFDREVSSCHQKSSNGLSFSLYTLVSVQQTKSRRNVKNMPGAAGRGGDGDLRSSENSHSFHSSVTADRTAVHA